MCFHLCVITAVASGGTVGRILVVGWRLAALWAALWAATSAAACPAAECVVCWWCVLPSNPSLLSVLGFHNRYLPVVRSKLP